MLKMLNDNVLIKEQKKEENIITNYNEKYVVADVIEVGPECTEVEQGDIVYLSRYSGIPYKDMEIVGEYEIVGKIT